MSNFKAITRATAAAYVHDRKKVLDMLKAKGVTINASTSNEKAIKTLTNLLGSDQKFLASWLDFLIKRGYLKTSDLDQDPSDLNSAASNGSSNYMGMTGDGWAGLADTALKGIGNMFKAPEVDTETTKAILELEKAKLDAAASSQSNAKFWVAGIAVVAVLGLTGIIIYKARK